MQNLKKILLPLLVIIVIILISIFAYPYYQRSVFESDLAEAISSSNEINMSEITEFEWDKFYIFGPYTNEERIEKIIGLDWAWYDNSMNDSVVILAFIKEEKVVMELFYPRNRGDFADLETIEYTLEDAVFIIENNILKRK